MSRGRPVYSGGKVHIMAERCETCIFRPGNPMHLKPGRVKEMVTESIDDAGAITCHSTLYGQAEQEAVCRGFYDGYRQRVPALKLAERLGVLAEVEPEMGE